MGEYTEVTSEVFGAMETLSEAFIGSPSFMLADAVAAVELMDPKMDVWMKSPTIKEYKEDASITDEEISGIQDVLLGYIMEWTQGAYFAQSVANCVFLHQETSWKFMQIVTRQLIPLIKKIAMPVIDEEDFYPYVPMEFASCPEESEDSSDRVLFLEALVAFLQVPQLAYLMNLKKIRSRIVAVSEDRFDTVSVFFDSAIAKHLWPPGPPRKFRVIKSFSQVWDSIDKLIDEFYYVLKNAQEITAMHREFFRYFQEFPRNMLCRAVAWKILEPAGERNLWLVTNTMLRNATRVHRNLRKVFPVILEDLTNENIEVAIRLMGMQLALGISLEISDVCEYGFIYWLLDFFSQMHLTLVLQDESRKNELAELQVNKVLFSSFFRLFVALEVGGFLEFPTPLLEARGTLYALRTRNFIGVGPFENFKRAAHLDVKDVEAMLLAVADALKNASATSPDATVKRTCIANNLAIAALLKGHCRVTKTSFKYSKLFPVVEVQAHIKNSLA